jgi:hypothetical protein
MTHEASENVRPRLLSEDEARFHAALIGVPTETLERITAAFAAKNAELAELRKLVDEIIVWWEHDPEASSEVLLKRARRLREVK